MFILAFEIYCIGWIKQRFSVSFFKLKLQYNKKITICPAQIHRQKSRFLRIWVTNLARATYNPFALNHTRLTRDITKLAGWNNLIELTNSSWPHLVSFLKRPLTSMMSDKKIPIRRGTRYKNNIGSCLLFLTQFNPYEIKLLTLLKLELFTASIIRHISFVIS